MENYIVIQENFYDGKLVRKRSDMYARLNDDGTLTGNYATIRELMKALEKEDNGTQDTANRTTEGSGVQEDRTRSSDNSSTSQTATVPAPTEAKTAPRKQAKK